MKKILKLFLRRLGYIPMRVGTATLNARKIGVISYMRELYDKIEDVEGSVVECGVGKGLTFLCLSTFASTEGKGRVVWGFDSFEGFPEPTKEDESPRNPKKGEWNILNPENMIRILEVADVDKEFIRNNIRLVKGFVEDTLQAYDGGKIAFLHVDVDLYSGHKHILETLVPQMVPGGLVLFDDYNDPNWPGATQAAEEYLRGKPWKLERHARSGKYYFIKTPASI